VLLFRGLLSVLQHINSRHRWLLAVVSCTVGRVVRVDVLTKVPVQVAVASRVFEPGTILGHRRRQPGGTRRAVPCADVTYGAETVRGYRQVSETAPPARP